MEVGLPHHSAAKIMPKQGVVKQQRVEIQTPRTKLEAMVATAPERAGGGAAVILHPYSLLGGSMNDHMVLELFRYTGQAVMQAAAVF